MAWYDAPKKRNHPDVTAYIADQDDVQKQFCQTVRDILHEDPDVTEFIAWGIPCYWRKGPYVYTSAAKAHVTLGFFRGATIKDDTGRMKGSGKSPIAKVVAKIKDEFPEEEYRAWLAQAKHLDETCED